MHGTLNPHIGKKDNKLEEFSFIVWLKESYKEIHYLVEEK